MEKRLSFSQAKKIFNVNGEVDRICQEKIETIREYLFVIYRERQKLIDKWHEVRDEEKWFVEMMLEENEKQQEKLKRRLRYWKFKLNPPRKVEFQVEEIKQIPITGILEKPVYESNGKAFYLSPFRQEKNASFVVYKESNTYYDFGSGEYGDVITLIQRLYDFDFKTACKFLKETYL